MKNNKLILLFGIYSGLLNGIEQNPQPINAENENTVIMPELQDLEQKTKPYIFDEGKNTKIIGNRLFDALHVNYQHNPSPEFEDILFVHCNKNLEYTGHFTVKDLRKAYSHKHPNKELIWDQQRSYEKHAGGNNAVVCPELLQKINRDGELKNVAVVIFGTQNTTHCERFKDFLDSKTKAD